MIEGLACSLGRNDEKPNIALAELLCDTNDIAGIDEIVSGLKGTDKAVTNDCIKVLYEIGNRKPELISNYALDVMPFLLSKNNRLVWGSMTVLAEIAHLKAADVFKNLSTVKSAYESGSVITRDNSITVFAKLCAADKAYEKEIFPFLLKHLATCRPKEVPQHAERMSVCINEGNVKRFIDVLEQRRPHLTELQAKRIDKVIKTKEY